MSKTETPSSIVTAVGRFADTIVKAVNRFSQRLCQLVSSPVRKWAANPKKTLCAVMTDGGRESYLLPRESLDSVSTIQMHDHCVFALIKMPYSV